MLIAASCVLAQREIDYKSCAGIIPYRSSSRLLLTTSAIADAGELSRLIATPCDEQPCQFEKGTNVNFSMNIIPSRDSNSATLDATFTVLGVKVPSPGINRNLCDQGPCPLRAGVPAVFNIDYQVPALVPLSKTMFTMKVSGDDGVEVCGKMPIVLT